jgi:hypothetical protein
MYVVLVLLNFYCLIKIYGWVYLPGAMYQRSEQVLRTWKCPNWVRFQSFHGILVK